MAENDLGLKARLWTDGSLYMESLAVRLGGRIIKFFVKSIQVSFRFLFLNLLSGIKLWANLAKYHGREWLGDKSTILEGSLHLQSLAGRLGCRNIKNFVKLLHDYFVSISFSWMCWVKSKRQRIQQIFMAENDLGQKARLWMAASTCRAGPWGLEATK